MNFWATPIGWTLLTLGEVLLVTVGILISLAFLLLADRKIWAGVQMRKGPNTVGPFGLFQSFADFFKFVLKEIVIPAGSDRVIFILAPVMIVMTGMFFISALAETNRPPFDLPDAESELVAGYQVEYSSTPYLLFMIGEYANIVLMCAMISILFFGGWQAPFPTPFLADWPPIVAGLFSFLMFAIKIVFWFFLFALVKAIVPRYRYDQLMRLGWKVFLPTSLVGVALVAGWRVFTQA